MDLKELIKETISQIVSVAKELNESGDASIENAITHDIKNYGNGGAKEYTNVEPINVEFDVAITVTDSEGAKGGAGIKVASIMNLGGGVESKTENQIISRVKFSLPLVLP